MEQWLSPVVAIVALTSVVATLLVFANSRLRVEEDPRVDGVEELLPHANCGACGYAGCRAFSVALVEGKARPAGCTVSDAPGLAAIARYLGIEVGHSVRRVARLACAGGTNVARDRAEYHGLSTCAGKAVLAGGSKGCLWGCLGSGDCERACNFHAIQMDLHQLPVVDEDRCTACGDCVTSCPKDLFSLVRADRRLFVRCSSQDSGPAALEHCEVACDACGRCAKDEPELVTMRHHLPLVDVSAPHASRRAIQRCPTGAIVLLDPVLGPIRGEGARAIARQERRAIAPAWNQSPFHGKEPST